MTRVAALLRAAGSGTKLSQSVPVASRRRYSRHATTLFFGFASVACAERRIPIGGVAPTQAPPMSADQASELERLRQENERLRMERDILKKSIAIFAGTRT